MILCLCEAVTERELRSAIQQGARSTHEISKRTRVGRRCGSCMEDVRRLVEEHVEQGASDLHAK